jgi:phosphoglycerate kinase
MSHLGRVKTEEDKKNNSLEIVSKRLEELLNRKVIFISETRGRILEDAINNMKPQDVLLIENTRFEDLDGEKESKNDIELGKYWASLGDIYINDAFGTSHRSHASNVGIASNLPNGIGFLIEKELDNLESAINNPERPFNVILGGAKVSDKIGVIKNIILKADHIIIGGGMAFTFLKASNLPIGSSILDEENIEFCKTMLDEYPDKIILPVDIKTNKNRTCFISDIESDEIGFDIGPTSIKVFKSVLTDSKTVIWNGPLGKFEEDEYSIGTKEILDYLSKLDAKVILGGGDTASSAKKFGYEDKFTHISTGGGASLELLEGKELPGIKIIDNK